MRAGDCKHFNGVQHGTCQAGVKYDSMAVWPCLPTSLPWRAGVVASECASFAATTAEEEAADRAEIDKALDLRRRGLSSCCEAPLDRSRLLTSGPHAGSGWLYCSSCKRAVMHVCARGGRRHG